MFLSLITKVQATVTAPPIKTSTSQASGATSIGAIYELMQTGLNWFFSAAMLLAVIILIMNGIKWMTSKDDSGKAEAQSRVIYAISGVAIILLAYVLVNNVIPAFLGVNLGSVDCTVTPKPAGC